MSLLPIATNRQVAAVLGAELRRLPKLGVAALLVQVAAVSAGLVAPWMLGRLVDQVIDGADRDGIVRTAAVIAGAAVVAGVLTAVAAALIARLGETVLARLRERVLDRVLHSPSGVIERAGTGDLVSRAGEDVSVVTSAITGSAP
ncbi:MAG: ABC transporter transmembrane domain-containing protein, partial [Actinoplanes sp.]